MRVKRIGLFIGVCLCLSISLPVMSAPSVRTVFGQRIGRVVLLVDHQANQVNVILEPNFGTYDFYDFDYFNQTDIQWIIPLPAPTVYETDFWFYLPYADSRLHSELNQLDDLTVVRFEPDIPRYCYDTFEYEGRSGDASYPAEVMAEKAEGTDYTRISNADAPFVIHQLLEAGYTFSDDEAQRVRDYAEAGFSFLAMKYHVEAQEEPGAYQYTVYGAPLTFGFQWQEETVPLPFLNLIAKIWIFDDQNYQSPNVPSASPDYSRFRAPHSIVNTGSFIYPFYATSFSILAESDYQEEMRRILADGALVTEYAGSTAILNALDDVANLNYFIQNYRHVSRFSLQLPESVSYPILEPVHGQPPQYNVINLNRYVDPLEYWGCSSRTALDDTARANLPDGRRRFDDLRFAVAYPAEWQFSELTGDDGTVYGFSPQPLTRDKITAALDGDPNQPPMFVFAEHTYLTDGYAGPLLTEQNLLTQFGIQATRQPWARKMAVRFDMRQKEKQQEHGVMYGILANEADWAKNEAMYRAMLAYAQSYQYFASAEWPNTLFIQSNPRAETVITLEIPYPDGWLEHMDGNDVIISNDTAEFRLIPADAITTNLLQSRFYWAGDLPCDQPTPFQANGRAGFIFPTRGYLAETSAPSGELAKYEATFMTMITALPDTCST